MPKRTTPRPQFFLLCLFCALLFSAFADARPIRYSRRKAKRMERRWKRSYRSIRRQIRRSPCRSVQRTEQVLQQLKDLSQNIRRWPRRTRRRTLRKARAWRRSFVKLERKARPQCTRAKLQISTLSTLRIVNRGARRRPCAATLAYDQIRQDLSLPKRTYRALPRRQKRSFVRWRRKRLRYIAKQRKRAERRCRRSWRTLTRDRKGTLRPSCAKRFRGPRRRRGQLWITSAPTADVYINRTYCGRTPIRLAIRAGTYDIKLRPKGNLYKPSATKVYVNRRQNSFVVKRTSDWNKRPTPRVATNDPPTRPPPRTQREPVTRFQPSMRKKTRTRTRRISRRQRRVSRRNKIKTLKNTPIEDPFWIAIGPRIFGRFFYYNDDIFQELFPYRLPIGPAISLQFHWYPGAHFTNNALAHIGLIGDFYYALGIQSRTPEPNSIALSTTAYQFHIGLRGRIPIGPIALQIDAGYAQQYFSINTQDPNTLSPVEFPATTYQTLRFGLRLYWSLSERFALFLHSAYRHPLSTGEIGSDEYFPRLFAGQFEAGLGFDVHLLTWMSLRMLGQYQHYFFSFNSEPGDRRVAGGALDQYYHVDLLVAFHF